VSQASADSRPRIAPGFRLQWEDAQSAHVLLYPEGMVKLNQSAGEILKRCNGERRIAEIARELERAFNAPDLTADVLAFVDLAGQQRWLVWELTTEARESTGAPEANGADPAARGEGSGDGRG